MREKRNFCSSSISLIVLCKLALAIIIHVVNFNGVQANDEVEEGVSNAQMGHHANSPLNILSSLLERKKNVFPTPAPHLRRRVKRQNEDDYWYGVSSEQTDNDGDQMYIQLPPKHPLSPFLTTSKLMDLISDGSKHVADVDTSSKDAILILGNTGSGKTTLTQIIAGDQTKLHAVFSQSSNLVIIDDDNRIGAPSTISKTLVPELVQKHELNGNITSFFDCPGFDDTRGPEEDIAANYFMHHFIEKVDRVKLLFLVVASSVKVGNERVDFDNLVSHATQFLKNIPNYRKSIALVVTKVESFHTTYRDSPIRDKHIMNGITEFLKMYRRDLQSQIYFNNNAISKYEQRKKIQFVDALLAQTPENSMAAFPSPLAHMSGDP